MRILLIVSTVFWNPCSSDHLAYIQAYLSGELGISDNLPELTVRYGPFLGDEAAHPSRAVYGAESTFSRTDPFLRTAPRVTWQQKEGDLHTVLMFDADARPEAPYLHWMVVNCVGSTDTENSVVYEYQGPNLRKVGQKMKKEGPKGTHRYVILLLKQVSCPVPGLSVHRIAHSIDFQATLPAGSGLRRGGNQQ